MLKVPIRILNFAEEIHFEDSSECVFVESDEKESFASQVDADELSNLLSYAMNLFYHHDYQSLKVVSDKILSVDYRNIRACLYKVFSEFFDQFERYERETVERWNVVGPIDGEGAGMREEECLNELTNDDFINDINRYLEYMESLENLSKKLYEISEITELLREEEIVQEVIIERLAFIDQKIAESLKQDSLIAQSIVKNKSLDYLKRLYADKYEQIIAKRDQLLNLSEKEFCYSRQE